MSNGFIESADGLRYEERISISLRLFVGVIGAGMFVIPVPFLLHAHLGMPAWQLLLVALCVVAPVLMGLLCLVIAFGRCMQLLFDSHRRLLLRSSRWPFGARWNVIDYAHLVLPDLLERYSEDGPFFVIRLRVQSGQAMHLGSFSSREEAEQWRIRIGMQLQG